MKYKPYEFKPQDAYDFAKFVHIQAKERNGELHFRKCPICGQLTNDKDTFGISLKTGQCKCLRATCRYQGNMITLARDFGFSLGTEVDEYYEPKKKFKTFKKPKDPIIPKPQAIQYLQSRGISEKTAKRYEITVQDKRPNILVFPFYDDKGELVYVKYRKTDFDRSKDDNKEWCEKGGKPILFGMKQCNPENKILIFTEGQIDQLSVVEAGYENVLSVPNGAQGFTWVPYCWNFVNQFETIIIFGDYEKGHMTLLEDFKKRFKLNIKHVRYDDYKDCKDANDILRKYGKEQIKVCIENAESEPIRHVKHMSQIVRRNPYTIPKVSSGIKELDVPFYGGLPFGYVVLLTGKTGEGKSVLASQFLLNAIEKGHKCFAYSGELPDWAFQAIIEYQAAGSHVFMRKDQFGIERPDISEKNAELINNWYEDQLLLYDDSLVEDDEETEKLTDVIEKVILQENVKFILLDNLMTGIDLDGDVGKTLYERQSAFVKKLARIAKVHEVLIVLVAHMRKNNGNFNGNDEVAGSSDVTNLAAITLMYESSKELNPDQRCLKIWKDRLFGHRNTQGIVLDYDEKSKRIYGVGDDVNRDYGWCPAEQFDDVEIPDEIPFE